GRAADRATIQFRMLNRSKGPAVWAPRAQCDRTLYRRAVRALVEGFPTLELAQGMVSGLLLDGTRAAGVATADRRNLRARAVILTAGTFLRGDRKSTRLNSSHVSISYAVFCLIKNSQQDGVGVLTSYCIYLAHAADYVPERVHFVACDVASRSCRAGRCRSRFPAARSWRSCSA